MRFPTPLGICQFLKIYTPSCSHPWVASENSLTLCIPVGLDQWEHQQKVEGEGELFILTSCIVIYSWFRNYPKFSGIKQPLYQGHKFSGSGIQTKHGWMACLCSPMFSVLSWTQRLKVASQPGVYYLKTCSFTCLATDVSYWLGPQLNVWQKYLHITSTPG